MKLEGTFTALVTPFKEGEIDYEWLAQNIRFQLDHGVQGILAMGTTGETPTLSAEEYREVIRIAVREAGGKSRVMAGTGTNSTQETIENTVAARELGVDAALIVTPYYNKPTQKGIIAHFEAVLSAVDLPVVVYNIPGRTGTNIETDTLVRLSEMPGIAGVKEASGRMDQIGDVIDRIQNRRENFAVLSGDDALTLPILALGGRGLISVVSNLVPDRVVSLVDHALEGDFEAARKIHFELLPLFKAAFIESNPLPIKAAMALLGMPAGECRLPLGTIDPESREKIRSVLRDMGLLQP